MGCCKSQWRKCAETGEIKNICYLWPDGGRSAAREGGGPIKTRSPDPPLEVSPWASQLTAAPLHWVRYCTIDQALFQMDCLVCELGWKTRMQINLLIKTRAMKMKAWKMHWMQEKGCERPIGEINDFIMEQKVEARGFSLPSNTEMGSWPEGFWTLVCFHGKNVLTDFGVDIYIQTNK